MDVGKLGAVSDDDGVVVHFKDRSGEPMYDEDGVTPVTARVVGIYSAQHRKIERRQSNQMLKSRRMQVDADQVEAMQIEREAACIVEWSFTEGGRPFPISADSWAAILKLEPQFQQQVKEAMENPSAFFVKPSTT